MNKAAELKTTTKLVKEILEKHPKARDSDELLYYMVCKNINEAWLNVPAWVFLLNRKTYGYPAFESVRRTRQKMQALYPGLAGKSTVEGQRKRNEEVFRNYARKWAV